MFGFRLTVPFRAQLPFTPSAVAAYGKRLLKTPALMFLLLIVLLVV